MKATCSLLSAMPLIFAFCFPAASAASTRTAEAASQKPAEKTSEKTQEKPEQKPAAKASPEIPARIELLETRVRFETDGSSRKEVHARVKINDELGVRQFARLNFDFNRSFEQIEIPLVRITHPNGGVLDVLPSAITDTPNPAVVSAPAYQDVRVKSVRILGLEPGDSLEYRVITTTSHAPLAPDIWLEHTFDRSGVVAKEVFDLDLPCSRLKDSPNLRRIQMNVTLPAQEPQQSASGRCFFQWHVSLPGSSTQRNADTNSDSHQQPDVTLSSFILWGVFLEQFSGLVHSAKAAPTISDKALALTKTLAKPEEKLEALYIFVSEKVSTVDLPLDATGYRTRPPADILASGYATPEDKFILLATLASTLNIQLDAGLAGSQPDLQKQLPRPSLFSRILTRWGTTVWCDPSLEVAPFGILPPGLRGKPALWVRKPPDCGPTADCMSAQWAKIPVELPFAAFQKVQADASLGPEGTLRAKLKYTTRGENELLLRVAFHKTPKENWKNVAQLLALSDGFRGQITNVTTSDPYETHDPFTVEYEITQPKFVDWSKKPIRIPALLPLLGLPDPVGKLAAGTVAKPIDLGTPLDVEVSAAIHLPAGTTANIPAGTSVQRDFATYTSQYSAKDATITAARHLNFILKEIPADRAADYNAFLQAVQNDESQFFTLERAEPATAKPQKP
ncbi:MAG: DUF3857 domain-containing protein [Candidatus Acidiferrum sp.]